MNDFIIKNVVYYPYSMYNWKHNYLENGIEIDTENAINMSIFIAKRNHTITRLVSANFTFFFIRI